MTVLACTALVGGLAAVGAFCLFSSFAVVVPLVIRVLVEERRSRRPPATSEARDVPVAQAGGGWRAR